MIETGVLWTRAEAALRVRRWSDAWVHLRQLLGAVDRIDFEYEEWLRASIDALRAMGHLAEARACGAYLGQVSLPSEAERLGWSEAVEAGNQGAKRRAAQLAIYLEHAGKHREAAEIFEIARMPMHRAVSLERAGADADAAEIWRELVDADRLRDQPYEQALVKINYGLCLERLGSEEARSAIGAGTRAVEEVADRFESEGLRERAFDCYQLLARVGIETQAFENVAEGFLNSVRILRDDALKRDALRLYEAFASLADQAGEHHAVATVLREAAEFCERSRLPYAEDLRMRSGEAWIRAAEAAAQAGHPNQIVENAFLAAAEAFVTVRAFRRAAAVYRALASLELRGRERYQRLLARLGDAPEDGPRPIPVPEFMKRLPEYEEVWYVDLAEWEIAGDPSAIAAGVLADRRFSDYVRRNALLLVLDLAESPDMDASAIVRRLQSIRAYPVIAALEALFERGDARLRQEVVQALGKVRFKRSFAVVMRALRSSEGEVRRAARGAIEHLYFPHAFDRLRAIFEARDLPEASEARKKAVAAIGKIRTPDAVEFLCDRLREDDPELAEQVKAALQALNDTDLVPYLREQSDMVPAKYRTLLEDVASRLGPRTR